MRWSFLLARVFQYVFVVVLATVNALSRTQGVVERFKMAVRKAVAIQATWLRAAVRSPKRLQHLEIAVANRRLNVAMRTIANVRAVVIAIAPLTMSFCRPASHNLIT